MHFDFDKSIPILERTPGIIRSLLSGLDGSWIENNDGEKTWSPFDVVGHLIHGEKTDWIARMNIILNEGTSRPFDPYDRFAQFEDSKGKTISMLLDEFESLRKSDLDTLKRLKPDQATLDLKGMHPSLGEVSLRQLLSTWTVHDLIHICQITKTMARQYKEEVGPWLQYINTINY